MGKDYDVYIGNTKVGSVHQQDTREEIEKKNADRTAAAKAKAGQELLKGIKEGNRRREAYSKMDGQSRYEYDKKHAKMQVAYKKSIDVSKSMDRWLIAVKIFGGLTVLSLFRLFPMISYFLNCLTGNAEFEMTGEIIALLLPPAITLAITIVCGCRWLYLYSEKSKADRSYDRADRSLGWLANRFK